LLSNTDPDLLPTRHGAPGLRADAEARTGPTGGRRAHSADASHAARRLGSDARPILTAGRCAHGADASNAADGAHAADAGDGADGHQSGRYRRADLAGQRADVESGTAR